MVATSGDDTYPQQPRIMSAGSHQSNEPATDDRNDPVNSRQTTLSGVSDSQSPEQLGPPGGINSSAPVLFQWLPHLDNSMFLNLDSFHFHPVFGFGNATFVTNCLEVS